MQEKMKYYEQNNLHSDAFLTLEHMLEKVQKKYESNEFYGLCKDILLEKHSYRVSIFNIFGKMARMCLNMGEYSKGAKYS